MNHYMIARQMYALARRIMAYDANKVNVNSRFVWNRKILWINENQDKETMKRISSFLEGAYNAFFKVLNKTLISNDFKMSIKKFSERGFKGDTILYYDEAGVEIRLNTIPFGSSQIITSVFVEDRKFIITDLKKVQIGYDEDEITSLESFEEYQRKIKKLLEELKRLISDYMSAINSEEFEDEDQESYDDSLEDRDISNLNEDRLDEF